MEMPSSLAVMLQGYDAWLLENCPPSEDAKKALISLQRAAMQMRTGREPIASVPYLLRRGQMVQKTFSMPALPQDKMLF